MTNSTRYTSPWQGQHGDHLIVDLANTCRRQGRKDIDLLQEAPDLERWLKRGQGVLPAPETITPDLVANVRSLRDEAITLMWAAIRGLELPGEAVDDINRLAAHQSVHRTLAHTAGHFDVHVQTVGNPDQVFMATLAAATVDLMGDPQVALLAFCDAPSCGMFYHRERANQRWCCPECGTRIRAERYQSKNRKAP